MPRALRWTVRLAALALAVAGAWLVLHGPSVRQGSFVVLDLGGAYPEKAPGGLVDRLLGRGPSLADVLETLRKVRHDGRIAGVLVRVDRLDAGWGQAAELRTALSRTKAAGKEVVADLVLEMAPASRELYVASAAARVAVAPSAAPLVAGLQAKAWFLGGVWPRLGVAVQVEKRREYKAAADEIAGESMGDAHREMLDSILGDVHDHFTGVVAEARNLSRAEVDAAAARGTGRPADLVAAGLANAVRSDDELLVELGGGARPPVIDAADYAAVPARSLGVGDGPRVAVVHVTGLISRGRGDPGDLTSSRAVARALADAAADSSIKAVVLRIASPGGSPAASDDLWLAVRQAAAAKPVVASLGDVAASGGYYVASAADRIVASPGTLTGSIGVLFAKPDFGGLMERVGLRSETLQRGRYARLLDVDKALDDDERRLVAARMDDAYGLFVERVAAGRRRGIEEIEGVAGGRVWTGRQALERGLVDELGGLDDAVRAAANAAGIHDADQVELVHLPRPRGLLARVAALGAGLAAPGASSSGASATPAARLADRAARGLGTAAALLELEPGIQAVADGLPDIR